MKIPAAAAKVEIEQLQYLRCHVGQQRCDQRIKRRGNYHIITSNIILLFTRFIIPQKT